MWRKMGGSEGGRQQKSERSRQTAENKGMRQVGREKGGG